MKCDIILGHMYVDEIDYLGLFYWYNDALDYNKEIEKQAPK